MMCPMTCVVDITIELIEPNRMIPNFDRFGVLVRLGMALGHEDTLHDIILLL